MNFRNPIGTPIIYNDLIYRWCEVYSDPDELTRSPGPPTLELVAYNKVTGSEFWSSGAIDARASVWDGWDNWIQDGVGIQTYTVWPYNSQVFPEEVPPRSVLVGDLFCADSEHGVIVAWNLAEERLEWRLDTSTQSELEFFRLLTPTEDSSVLVCACYRQTLQDCTYRNLEGLGWGDFPYSWEDGEWQTFLTDTILKDVAEGFSVKKLITSHNPETGVKLLEYLLPENDAEGAEECGNSYWEEFVLIDTSLKNPNLDENVHVSGWWTGYDQEADEAVPGGAAQYREHCQHPYYSSGSGGFETYGANIPISATLDDGEFLSRVSIMEKLEGLLVVTDYNPFGTLSAYPGEVNLLYDTYLESHVQWLANTSRPLDPNDRRRWVNLRCSSDYPHPKESRSWGPVNQETYGYVHAQRRAAQRIFGGDYNDFFPLVTDWTATLDDEQLQDVNAFLVPPLHNWACPFFSITSNDDWASDLGRSEGDLLNFHVLANRTLYGVFRRADGFYTFTRSIDGMFNPYHFATKGSLIVFGPTYDNAVADPGKWLCLDTTTMTVAWERDADNSVRANCPVIVGDQVITATWSDGDGAKVVALDLATGDLVSEVALPEAPDAETQPIIGAGKYWFGAGDVLRTVELVEPAPE